MLNDILNILQSVIIQVSVATLSAILGYVGLRIKTIIEINVENKTKKEVIEATIRYVEQTGIDLTAGQKKKRIETKALEWLDEQGIKISEIELDILIESSIHALNN